MNSSKDRGSNAGGAATTAGVDYQYSVAAWLLVRMLAEQKAAPLWELDTNSTIEQLRAESAVDAVDDLVLTISNGGRIYIQAKRSIENSSSLDSDLASVFQQFVSQFIESRDAGKTLCRTRDRLILVTSSRASNPVRHELASVLAKTRGRAGNDPHSFTVNESEKKILANILGFTKSFWQGAKLVEPTDDEVCSLLELIHILVLDVESGKNDAIGAKDLLRSTVLTSPEQDTATWALLIKLATDSGKLRSGLNRVILQQHLGVAGILLKATPSYEQNTATLAGYSSESIEQLRHLSEIRTSTARISIVREVAATLRETAEQQSCVVVGLPGSGKSGALIGLCTELLGIGFDVVFISVDRVTTSDPSGRIEAEIGLTAPLLDVLSNWPGDRAGFLVIDGLDAARGDRASAYLRRLIGDIQTRSTLSRPWRILVSIRKYDLRYSAELRELFPGTPPAKDYMDAEFSRCCHIEVPLLSSSELALIADQNPEIDSLLSSAPPHLGKILQTPFHLRIAAEMITEGISPIELSEVSTQLELMDRYWEHRVIRGAAPDATEGLLRQACTFMVDSRDLRVARGDLVKDPHSAEALRTLLSTNLLLEWQSHNDCAPDRYILAFPHNVLFDYAVARLLLRQPDHKVFELLKNDLDLPFVVQPSFVFHFTHRWQGEPSRKLFWEYIFELYDLGIPLLARISGPRVAYDLCKKAAELVPLEHRLLMEPTLPATRNAVKVFCDLIGAAFTQNEIETNKADILAPLLRNVSRKLNDIIAWPFRALLLRLLQPRDSEFALPTLDCLGQASRLLFIYSSIPRQSRLIRTAIKGVCHTFATNSSESEAILRSCLTVESLKEHGFEDLPAICGELDKLVQHSGELVADIYKSAFGFQEKGSETTVLLDSIITRMTSTRKQDYQHARYLLKEFFPKFLEQYPNQAVTALISVIGAYQGLRTRDWDEKEPGYLNYSMLGHEGRLALDSSGVWDYDSDYNRDEPLEMLRMFTSYCKQVGYRDDRIEAVKNLVVQLVRSNEGSALWRRLALAGAEEPATLGLQLLPLLTTTQFWISSQTRGILTELLKVTVELFTTVEVERIESAVKNLSEKLATHRRKLLNILAARLGKDALEDDPAPTVASANQALQKDPVVVAPIFRSPTAGLAPRADQEIHNQSRFDEIASAGKPDDSQPGVVKFPPCNSQTLISYCERLADLFERLLGDGRPKPSAEELLVCVEELYLAIHQKSLDGEPLGGIPWRMLAKGCRQVVHDIRLLDEGQLKWLAQAIKLLSSSNSTLLQVQANEAEESAKLLAIDAMTTLIQRESSMLQVFTENLIDLVLDPSPGVRSHLASSLPYLAGDLPLMWELFETLESYDSPEVDAGLMQSIHSLANQFPGKAVDFALRALERPDINHHPDLLNKTLGVLINQIYALSSEIVGRVLDLVMQKPSVNKSMISRLFVGLRDRLAWAARAEEEADVVTVNRAVLITAQLAKYGQMSMVNVESRNRGKNFEEWLESDQQDAKVCVQSLDHLSAEVYFASGAYDDKTGRAPGKSHPSALFYQRVCPVFEEFAKTTCPQVAYYLVETLEHFIPIEPCKIFLLIAEAVEVNKTTGYVAEQGGCEAIVRIVQRYLAEYRTHLQTDRATRQALRAVLEAFIEMGWPQAFGLIYRLPEVYR